MAQRAVRRLQAPSRPVEVAEKASEINLAKVSIQPEIKISKILFDPPVIDNSAKMLAIIKAFGIKYKETTIDEELELKIRNKYLGKGSIYMLTFVYGNVVLIHYSSLIERNKAVISLNGISLSGETESSKFHKYYKEGNYYCIPVYNPVLESLFN